MARRAVTTRPLSHAMRRMQIPLRRIRQGFETRDVRDGGLYGKLWWRRVDGARVGGVFGFITDPRGWGDIDPHVPGGLGLPFLCPRAHRLPKRPLRPEGSPFRKGAPRSPVQERP